MVLADMPIAALLPPPISGKSLNHLGMIRLERGELGSASVLYAESLGLAGELGDQLGTVWGLAGLAGVALAWAG